MNSQPPGSGKSNNISSNNDPNKQLPVAPDNEEKSGSPVTRVNPEPMLPQGGSGMPGQVLRERNASIAGQQISQQMQQHLDEFSFNGSAHALLAMLNSQTGLNGQFEIVFQPNKGGDPIPFNKFTEHPAINQAYQKIAQKIAQNHQSIAYGLAEKMAMLQQQMAMVAMQQQQMQMANMAFMQALLNPVIQPMAVPLDYLLGFKGQQVPGFQHNPAMGWGGMPGGVAPQPTWANYPKFLQMPQPFEQANALPKGLCAIPQPQQGMGLQMPFSPWGWYAQNNPATGQGQDALLNQLQQFTNARPSSLVPPWAWGPPVIVNRIFPNSGKKQSSPEGVTVNPAAAAINPAGTAVTPAEISVNTGPVTVNTGEKTVNPAGAPKSQEVNNNDYSVILSHLKEIKGILSSISGNAFSDAQFAKLQYSIERLNNQFTQYLSLGRKDEAEITRLQQTTRYLSEQLENQQVKTLQGIAKILENQIKNLQNKFNTQNESNNHDINSKPKKALGSNKESNDLVEIKNKLDSLANQLKELTPDYSSDAQNDSKYKELFKSFMSYVRGAKEENLPHRKGHENKAEEAEALKEKINNIKEELHAIKRGKNNASNRDKENIAALEERLSELENKIALLEDYRNKIDKEKSDNKYDKLLEKLIELEDYVKKAETENADFKKGQLIVSTETEALKKQINDIKEELYDIKRNKDNGVNQAKENSLAIEQKIKSLADQISLLKKNKEKEDNEEDSSHYTQQLAKIEALQKDLERARAENSALRKGEENRSKEIETLKQEIKKAKEDFNAIRESSHSSESMSSIRSSLDNRSINSDKDLLKEGSEKSQNTERAFEHNESNLTNSEKISSGHVSSRTDNDTELNQDPSSTTSHSTKTELSSVATAIESYAKDLDDLYEDDLYEKVNNYYGILYSKIESNKNKVESVIKHADDFHEKLDEEELDKIVNHLKFIQSDLNENSKELDAFNKNIKDNIENAKKELKNNAVIKEISDVIENRKNEDLSHQENVRESIEALSDDLDSLIDQKNDAERKEELRLKQEAFFRNLEYKDNEIADIENQLNAAEQSYEAQVKKIKSLEDNVGYYRVEDFKETENLILSVDGFLDEANGLANEIKGNIESARSNLHEASNKIGTSKENLGDVDAEYEIAEQEIKDTKKTIDDIQIANEEIKSILNKASKKEEGIKNQIIEKAKNIGDQLSSMIMAKKEEIDEKEKAIDQAENNYNQANSFYEEYPVEIAKDFEDRFFELSENFSQLDEEYGNKIGYLKNNLESIAKVKDKIEQASIEDGSIFSAIKEAEEVISDNISSEIVDNSDVDEFIAECNSFKEALSQEKFQQQLNSINLLLDRTQAIKSNNALADEGIKQFKTNLDALRENEFGESDDIKILLDQCEHNINSADNKRNELVAKAEKAMIGLKQISGEISGTYNNENVMPIKEEEISSHQRDIDILEEELRNFGVLLDDINSDLYKINKEIENKDKSDIDKLKNECINTKPLAQEVINKITENQKAIKEIHNDTDTYFRKYECVKEGKESSKEHTMNAIFEFEDKLEEQLAKAEEYENKINAEVTKIDSINSDKSVHGYKESVKKTIEKIKSDIGKDNKTQDENAGRITELSTKANELKEALEKAWLTKCNQAEIEVTGIKNKAKSINKSYQEKKKEITKLEAEVNDFKVNESSKIDEALGKKLTEVMYSIKYLERIQDQGTNDIIDFNKRLDDVLSIIESSKKGNNDIHSNNETIEHSIAGARNDINNFDQEVTSYLGILKQAKQTFETVKDIVEEKNKTNRRNAEIFLKQLKKQIDKINDNLDKFIIKASNVKESIQYSHEDIPKSLIHKYKDDFEDIKLGNEYFYDELRKYKEVAENVKHNIYEIDPSEFDDKEKSRYEINIEDFHKSLEEFEEQANKIDSNIAQLQQKIKDEFVDENRSGVNGLIQLNNSHGEIFSRIVEELNLLNHEANSILKECLPSEEAKPAAHALINEIRLLQNKIAKYKNDDEAVYLFKKIDLELHKIQAEIAKIEENKPALSYKDVVKKITGLSEYISRFNQDKNEKYVAQLRGFFGKIKNNFEKFKRSEKINLVLSLNDSIDVEGDLAEINEKISALDKDKQKCFDEAKESVNNVTRTSTTRVINEIIGGCNEINTRWNEALEKIKKVDQTKVGDLTRSFPPDYLPQIAEKKKIIDEFKKSFVLQVESLNNKLDGEDNRAEIEDIVQKFITYLSNINNTAICYSKKFEKIATYIYEDCHRKFSAEGSNFYRQYAINHPLMVSKEGHHVTDELKDVNLLTKAITDIIKGKEVNTPNIVERQIKEYFVNSTFDPDKIWQALHGVLCKAIIDSNGGNYNPETSSHVKGYMAGRIIQAVCLAVYAHMDKHVSNKLASDDLDDLKSQYDNIIKLLHPENWGIGASGDNRSSFISEASKRYIEQALEDTKNKISIKFSGIKGSPVAIKALEEHSDIKAMTSQLNKAVKLHAPEENNRLINSAKKLISSNPAFAKRWVETSLSLFYLGNQAIAGNTSSIEAYGMASQKLIVSLLQEFKINEQIPLSALLIATLKDISTANSLIRQALKLHYSKNKKDRKTNIDRVDKYANQIISLISKIRANKAITLQGMTLDKNNYIIDHHHKDLLDAAVPKTVINEKVIGPKSDAKLHCELLNPIGSVLLGEKHNLTGQIFCGLPQFTKQALSIRTNEQADPIEILGLTKSVWEVSPQILLNNPDIKIPFFNKNIDGKKCINGFIPVRNTGRGVEEQSEGILVPLKDECLLFTLTAEKKWRCQSFGNDFNSEQHSEQKYIGYATLAMAYSAQRGNDEAVKGALIQAYQEWCDYNRSDENGLNKFIEKITDELRKIKNSSVWINVKDREEALKDCLRNLKDEFKENNKNKIKGYATDLSKVTGFIVHKGMDDIHSEPNKAISRLSNKLSSKSTKAEEEYKKKSAFASRSAKDGGGFFSPKVSHGFTLYDKEFIKTLKENRPSESKLFSFMSTYRDKFISDFIGTLSGFSDVVIDDNIDKANLTDNIKSIDRIISKLNFEKINLKGERARLYQGVKKYLVKADTNISDIDDAKRLWVQGRIPSGLNDKDKDIYIETMHHLTQVSWIENTLHQHIDKLCKHKGKIEKLKREKIDITNRITFQNAARQLNGELAKIKNSFDELNDLINNKKNMSYASDPARSLLGFMESRNIQLRKNQVDVVPKLLEEQSNAIRDEKPTRLFLMEGTGGGKTLCMEAMVDNALNSLTKKDNQFKITHPVMVIAPDTNEAQLRSSLAVAEGQKGRVIKVMQPVLKNLTDKYGKETFTKEESLRKIYNLLLGVDINTIADDLNNQVGSRRSACLLSFSSFQLLLHATESALLVTNLTPESKELLNLIRDLFSNGIIFGDECVSGPLPYTAYDEDRIIQNIKNTMVGLDSNNVTPDSACKKAIGVMSNCFLFTGLSATKGSAAIGALFAGSSTYEETAKKLNENIKTTRLRAFDRLSEGKVVLSKDNKNEMAAKMVANLGSNRGIIILDTVTRETANKGENSFHMKLATEWQESLKSARDSNKDKSTEKQVVLTTSYIDGDGNTMLYDPDRLEYSGKDETRLGAVINPSDATSLKNSGARTHDSILGYDQGIGSDPIQGEQTAFVITGLFGAAEHGRSDLVEQWAGRGTRASSEPYNRQDILLMVTTSELDEIINSDSSSRAMKKYAKDCKLCADKLDEAKTKLDQVLENESLSESIRSKIQSSINTRLHIEHNSEDGINDIKNKIKQEANQVSSYLIQDLKEVISDKTTLNKIEKAVNKYLIAEELFQLETHLLLFNAMAQRENNAFTARHESWAFEGDKEYFLQKMYAKQEHWARNESAEFKNKYGGEIKLLVDSEFNKTVIGDKSKLESSTHGKLMEYVAAIIKLDYVIKKTKDNSSFGISAQDVSRRSEEVLKLYKFGNANILNNDNIKAMLTNIADNTSWVRHKDEIKNYFVHYKKAKEAYEKTAVILDNYSKDYPTREFVKDNMTESFEQVLSNITRVSLRGYEKSEELLESTVARPNFLNKLSSELDTAVNKSGEDFTTSMLTLERGKFVKLDVATINFKLEAKIYAESINKILDDIRKKVGGKEIFNGFLSGKFIGLENDVNEFLENIDNIDSYEFESRFNIIKNSISDYLFELSNDVFFGAKDVSVGTSKVDGILYSIIKLFKGPEFNTNTPTIKQRVNGHGYIENGFCIGKPTAGEEKPVSLITIIKDSVTIELPRKLIEARDSYRKQRAEVAALKTRDKLFAEKLKQKGQEIKNKILEDYRNSCQTNLKEQARNKDRLRQEQEKMKLL